MTILIAKIQACALYFQHESMRRVGQLHLTSIGADDMKQSLQPGISLVRRIPVGQERTISLMGEEGRVYATPYLIGDIEHTCPQPYLGACRAERGFGRHGGGDQA